MATSIFPTFFMAGFECSTFLWKDGERKDYIRLTGHDRHLSADCECVKDLGIGVVREAVPWPFVDLGSGRYDWSRFDPVLETLDDCGLVAIWDLFHYGLPDGCDPFEGDCRKRFVDYCQAVAERLKSRSGMAPFFTPVNEITFFAAGASDMAWMYPFAKGRNDELKRRLCQMSIEAVKAIRDVIPEARMVHVDPMVHAVPPPDRPDLADEAHEHAYDDAYEGFDMLYGRRNPELGGSPEVLDIVGVNVYHFSQAQMNEDGSREVLGPRDPRRKPLSEMLLYAWNRYHLPIVIGETSGYQDRRAEWLRMTMEECFKALNEGVDLQGVCLYPFVDIPDWNSGEWAKIGVFDISDLESCERIAHDPYIEELRRWERVLDQPEHFEPDGGGVQLEEVRRHAREWAVQGEAA
ncbi:MAG TPA: hypothetical protein VM328_13960 [Fimbriimonadaceae bacterium]|nr:hypothetical protein [Fimbriimonadaceae bacterium]